ncbi:hypothetical protein [Lysobacter sp. CFH 32150]|uniref:hypothetical protein n=1 Tax=Lysobacter sp. CFH 32150 TaxID=2927128 RepID=UPI001FA76D1D|nr:hypothetical protein [Lysobacter sp. CFH 32150]MCI4568408.1 hypothetical protein [Lysobacter sp. CFH 32150]
MNVKTKILLLPAALSFALFAAVPAFAQDTATDNTVETDASVPKDRLVDRYSGVEGFPEDATDIVTDLRSGGDFTTTTTETKPVLNADGTQATNPDGSLKFETVTTTATIENPNGPMGWGEVNITLAMAEKLIASGDAASLDEALTGTSVTNADGTVTTTDGLLQMRADGMGWGKIAKELGFKLGSVVGKGKTPTTSDEETDATTTETTAKAKGKSDTAKGKTDRTAKAERSAKADHGKPERVAKVDRPSRPERVERPSKPERPERPSKPERGGRP